MERILSIETSCLTIDGIHELRETITRWVAEYGIVGVGIKEIEEIVGEEIEKL